MDIDQLPNPSAIDPEIQKKANELAVAISKFVNSMSGGREKAKALGEAMLQDHRTLLQTKFLIAHAYLKGLATNYSDRYFDVRNQRACELADKMISALDAEDELYLPYI